jgi:hypothetical protein
MKINFSEEAMDKLMSLSRHLKRPPQDVVDNLLKSIDFEEAVSYEFKETTKNSKKE